MAKKIRRPNPKDIDKLIGDPDAMAIVGTTKTIKVERDEPKKSA